ncbi:MAG: methylmalonyl Co-A mutase-associated GTPase MeaB [Candidatus Lokiarchaeota archaeon]|nr:methylmalonyl Co-A mutase-associated GTPase MeaB [Candidatus Lokiarchaeota archaeon]MBD3201875.1 methylmalonyl Co-A mutase-associated GTPase MeaB [Candidatus Lokiarchaeota archaeon]
MSEKYKRLISKLLEGDIRSAARLITLVENDIQIAEKIISQVYKHTGNAYILGITGAPGSGKSTFISTLVKKFIEQEKKIGIICVDPTSPLTGGALLGDRIRMKQHFSMGNVFIRSMANRGQLGGLARATEDTIKILDAFGCDIIIVETVGVGQSEVDIFKSAHTVLVLLVPGMGDDIQVIKAGIMEITDIFIVNKMDLPGADRKVSEIVQMLELNMNYKFDNNNLNEDFAKINRWTPEIIKTNSKTGENFENLLEVIAKHKEFLLETGVISNYLKSRIKSETLKILKYKLSQKIEKLIDDSHAIEELIEEVKERSMDPYSMANKIVQMLGIEENF